MMKTTMNLVIAATAALCLGAPAPVAAQGAGPPAAGAAEKGGMSRAGHMTHKKHSKKKGGMSGAMAK